MSGPAEGGYFEWTYHFAGAAIPALLTVDYYVYANNVNTGLLKSTLAMVIGPVPIIKRLRQCPSAVAWLLGSGLLGLAAIWRRFRR
jgi:hypothetical protein